MHGNSVGYGLVKLECVHMYSFLKHPYSVGGKWIVSSRSTLKTFPQEATPIKT